MPGTSKPTDPARGRPSAERRAPVGTRPGSIPSSGRDVARGLRHLTWFRLALVATLAAAALTLDALFGPPGAFDGAFGGFLLMLAGAVCALSVAYLALLPRTRDLETFGLAQVAGDLAFTSMLVHATGGAASAFAFLYPVSALTGALVFYRRGALLVSFAGAALFAMVAIGGYRGLIPPLPGQSVLPWDAGAGDVARLVATNAAACFTVGVLGGVLSAEVRGARAEVAVKEASIRDLARLNDAIIRSLPSGLVSTDMDGLIRSANAAAHEILGAPPEGLLGRRLGDAAPDLQALAEHLRAGEGDAERVETAVTRSDGVRVPVGVSVSPLREPDGAAAGRVLSFQDLTHVRRMEEAVRRSEHLAGIGRLAAGIAHELRNPLASMSGSIELLRGAKELGPDEKRLMHIVAREVGRLSDLVTGLLDYARPRTPHKVPMDFGDLVSDVVRVFREQAEKAGIAVFLDAPRGVRVEADASQMRQVVWNLLRNAQDVLGGGGRVETCVFVQGERAAASVRDSGPGIPPEVRGKLFEPFFTTKGKGTGLGLATARRIVEEHGGAIEVDPGAEEVVAGGPAGADAPARGATFTIWLPVAEVLPSGTYTRVTPEAMPARPGPSAPSGKPRV